MESVSLLTGLISRGAAAMKSYLQPSSVAHMVHSLIGAWREAGHGSRGTRIGEASNPGLRRVRKFQPVGEDVVTSDSEDTPFVGAVVSAPSTSGAHHDCRVGFKVRDDIRKRMRLTSDRQTSVSEVTTGESIDNTLLDALELDLSGLGTGSDVPQGQVRINATQVDSDEEPLMRSAVAQQDAPVLCAGPSRQLSPDHGSFPRAVHRRGLVVEVAPGVVDDTAVALSSAPNVITYVVKSDEPANEVDFQGPTWVGSDDELMDNEPLVTIAEGTTVVEFRVEFECTGHQRSVRIPTSIRSAGFRGWRVDEKRPSGIASFSTKDPDSKFWARKMNRISRCHQRR